VCVVDQDGDRIFDRSVESSPEKIAAALAEAGQIDRAVIETGRMSPAICLGLRRLDVNVVCIDAHQAYQSLKAMKANKTDPHDAAGLAQFEPPRVSRRPFRLSHAAMAGCSSMA